MSEGFFVALSVDALAENQVKLVKVNDIGIALVKHNGEVFALNNRCPHNGCPLSNGKLEDYYLKCPCHGWRFDIRTGQYQMQKNLQAKTYQTKIENGQIMVKAVSGFW